MNALAALNRPHLRGQLGYDGATEAVVSPHPSLCRPTQEPRLACSSLAPAAPPPAFAPLPGPLARTARPAPTWPFESYVTQRLRHSGPLSGMNFPVHRPPAQ